MDGHGVAGMERVLDDRLSNPATARRRRSRCRSTRASRPALESELAAAMTKFSAIGAAGVVLDIKTGEVLAMTSLPQLNPNAPGQAPVEARIQPRDSGRLRARLDLQAVHRRDGDGQRHHQQLRQGI